MFAKSIPALGGFGYVASKAGARKLRRMMRIRGIRMGVDYALALDSLDCARLDALRKMPPDALPFSLRWLLAKEAPASGGRSTSGPGSTADGRWSGCVRSTRRSGTGGCRTRCSTASRGSPAGGRICSRGRVDEFKAEQGSRPACKPPPDHPWRRPFKPEAVAAG